MKFSMATVAALALCMTGASLMAQETPPHSSDNAALIYWQAMAAMPTFTDQEEAVIGDWSARENPLRAQIVERTQPSIRLMRQAAAKQNSDWGIDMSAGPHTLLPHLQKLRQLSQLGLVAATQKMHENQPMEAAQIAVAVLRMARHINPGGTLIEMLVQVAIQTNAAKWIAQHAPQMTPEARQYMLEQLEKLPPAATTASSMQGEKLFLDWARRQFEAGNVNAVSDLATGEDVNVSKLKGVQQQQLLKWLDQAEGWYDQTVAAVQQPYPQPAEQIAQIMKQVETSDNLLARIFFPSIERVWVIEHQQRAMMAMLQAGLQRLNKADAAMRDPYGQGEFQLVEHAGGFTLTSKLQRDNKPVELTFGTPPNPAVK